MDISDSSSDDDNVYVNAAYKFNALNRQAKTKVKDLEDDDDDEEMSNELEEADPPVVNELETNSKDTIESDDCFINLDDVPESVEKEIVNKYVDEDAIIFVENDEDSNTASNTHYNTRSSRTTRNSNKENNENKENKENKKNQEKGRKRIAPAIELNDTIEQELNQYSHDDSLNLSQEESDNYVVIGSPPPAKKVYLDNYEVSIKVLWRSNKMERFEIQRYDTFQKVFRHFANLEGVPEDQIFITKKDKRITPFDTPVSIDWSILDILDGGVLSAEVAKKNKGQTAENGAQENTCKIKIQTSDKRTLSVSLKYDQTFVALVQKCSEQLKIPESKMKFYFDGDFIDIDETPESLDFDDEACIDLKILA